MKDSQRYRRNRTFAIITFVITLTVLGFVVASAKFFHERVLWILVWSLNAWLAVDTLKSWHRAISLAEQRESTLQDVC